MTAEVGYSNLRDSLTRVAGIMWERDCGIVPVVDDEMKVRGVITDRDICVAVASRNLRASEIRAAEFVKKSIVSCAPGDEVEDALKRMRKYKVRRLPVVDADERLVGILSVTDILLKSKDLKKKVLGALRAIGKPPPILLNEISSETEDKEKDENALPASTC